MTTPAGPPDERTPARHDIVIPTVGRPSLAATLTAIDPVDPDLGRIVVVDDRRDRTAPLPIPGERAGAVTVVAGHASGPASARNVGWRASGAPWVVFLDDDTVPGPSWADELRHDLVAASPSTAGVQGRIEVPLPTDRRPTDWERNVAGLARARWITADLAVRRVALEATGGFDERFGRAYREDTDLALRLLERGWQLHDGGRRTVHPVRSAPWWASVRAQAGNADDVTMRLVHGRRWRDRVGEPPSRRPRHVAITALATPRRPARAVGVAAAAGWLAGTAAFVVERSGPGPRTGREVATMALTSAAIPVAATWWWARGWLGAPARLARSGPGRGRLPYPDAVLFDRDGTLVDDVPYNGDPDAVRLRTGAVSAVERLRRHAIPIGLVTNQSGVARGILTRAQVDAVNARVAAEIGGLDHVAVCEHGADDGCGCRKPAAGLVLAAAAALQVEPSRCVVIGDIGADVEAARSAGARGILVPTAVTRVDEVERSPEVAPSLLDAVELVLGGAR